MFDRKEFFDKVRGPLFSGSLTQQQVDGMNFILDEWEAAPLSDDLRHLAYPLATTKHETASTMWPIEEYGKGSGMSYGKPDPETGQTYYGRGFVQLTWRDNYRNATAKLGLPDADDLEWHADRALDPTIAADIMFRGMWEGWFRAPNKLTTYFSDTKDDAFGAREIINGDKNTIPSWANGQKIGTLIAGYHKTVLSALQASWSDAPAPSPPPPPESEAQLVMIDAPPGLRFVINGVEVMT